MYWLWHAYALVSARIPLANFVWLPEQNYIFSILCNVLCSVFAGLFKLLVLVVCVPYTRHAIH